jgi:iron(III) transport system substrate-binding protein
MFSVNSQSRKRRYEMDMKKRFVPILVSVFVLGLVGFANAASWQKIVKKAKAEGKVVVYSSSSRIPKAGKTFKAKYGIEVEGHDLGSTETVQKALREQKAKIYHLDVIFTSGAELVHEFLKKGYVKNFVPPHLVKLIPKQYREPLLVQRMGGGVVLYNKETYPDKPPIDNTWDLTRPKWKGKVLVKDPMKSGSIFGMFANYVAHADEMKAAYERKYGKLKLSKGVSNAGYEFIYRLLKNDLVLMKGGGGVGKAIGIKGQKDPPIGFGRYSRLRDNSKKGYVLAVANIPPMEIQLNQTYVGIAGHAPHPNAAKLMIDWLMGNPEAIGKKLKKPYNKGESGRLLGGFASWFTLGNWSPMTGYPAPEGASSLEGRAIWTIDEEYVWKNGPKIQEFWMLHGG